MPDPRYQLNCPHCGKRLRYLQTLGDVHVYDCCDHGRMAVFPNGRVAVLSPPNVDDAEERRSQPS